MSQESYSILKMSYIANIKLFSNSLSYSDNDEEWKVWFGRFCLKYIRQRFRSQYILVYMIEEKKNCRSNRKTAAG